MQNPISHAASGCFRLPDYNPLHPLLLFSAGQDRTSLDKSSVSGSLLTVSLFQTGLSRNRVATHRANIQPDSCCPAAKTNRARLGAAGLSLTHLRGNKEEERVGEHMDHRQKRKGLCLSAFWLSDVKRCGDKD